MIFLVVLAAATLISFAVPVPTRHRPLREAARFGLATAMIVAGVAHWLLPAPFLQHLPPWVPAAEVLIVLSGGVEVALGLGLLLRPRRRRWSGLALAAYLIAVFPANVYVALADVDVEGQPGGPYPWLRLPLQALFVAWALWSTGWPLRAARTSARRTPIGRRTHSAGRGAAS
jgi:uncharacterized membrane protein